MVMTAGSGRIRKTATAHNGGDANKELSKNDQHEVISSVSDNLDLLTNDQGDIFYGPAPKLSFKLDNSFVARSDDAMPKKTREETWTIQNTHSETRFIFILLKIIRLKTYIAYKCCLKYNKINGVNRFFFLHFQQWHIVIHCILSHFV